MTTEQEAVAQLPVIGYIPLGTGNGVGSVVGARIGRFRKYKKLRQIFQTLKDFVLETVMQIGPCSDTFGSMLYAIQRFRKVHRTSSTFIPYIIINNSKNP